MSEFRRHVIVIVKAITFKQFWLQGCLFQSLKIYYILLKKCLENKATIFEVNMLKFKIRELMCLSQFFTPTLQKSENHN